MTKLQDQILALLQKDPNPELDYYATTIFLSDKGTLQFSCFTAWEGFTDDSPPREIRKASLVHADRMLNTWKKLDEPGMVIETPSDLGIFFSFGGHAVVEKELADAVISEWLALSTSVNIGEFGFTSIESLPEATMRRAPSPKLRMKIIERDNYRCCICGRSPHNYVDLELHVHHIRPWASGGVTEESNLITLCHTCHNGLDPHFDFKLFKFLKKNTSNRFERHQKKLESYQSAVANQLKNTNP